MQLRELRGEDAPFMLEWMHDPSVVKDLKADFKSKTLNDCERFIKAALCSADSIHLAIVNDEDEYMGTVSLKHIKNNTAEFGIAVRRCAMGKGFAGYGMHKMIEKGFNEIRLDSIYWCVAKDNKRALRFYEKNAAEKMPNKELNNLRPRLHWSGYTEKDISSYCWFQVVAR